MGKAFKSPGQVSIQDRKDMQMSKNMKLSTQDADQFFELMWSLQEYVNLKLEILPDIDTMEEYKKLPRSQKLAVRDALYDNIELVDEYLKENPQDLSEEELEIVGGWKKKICSWRFLH